MMKTVIISISFLFLMNAAQGQKCSALISKKRDADKDAIFYTGLTTSKEYYSLMFQKEVPLNNIGKGNYIIFLNAASGISFSDSMLTTLAVMDLTLNDNSILRLDSVQLSNNPLGMCCSLGFKAYLQEEELRKIGLSAISRITTTGLSTTFSGKKMKEQLVIVNCLLTQN